MTSCHFRELSDEEITHYLEFDQPFDTAGSAKAESLGISLMESMRSDDPTAIIGLPLIELCRMLRHFGLNPTLTASSTNLIS
ncbi:septum formation protein Maf [Oligella ureolytica]